MPFRILEHTADIGLEITAETPDELFREAALGLAHLLCPSEVEDEISFPVTASASSLPNLLVDWLSALHLLFETKGFIWHKTAISVSQNEFRGRAYGQLVDKGRHRLHYDIKAVTYHKLAIQQSSSNAWHAQVYFDI